MTDIKSVILRNTIYYITNQIVAAQSKPLDIIQISSYNIIWCTAKIISKQIKYYHSKWLLKNNEEGTHVIKGYIIINVNKNLVL